MLKIHDRIGPYQVEKLLGQGGMAAVYKVWHNELHRFEALKIPHTARADSEFAIRFLREARHAALQHPHIVAIHNVSTQNDAQLYFTMELIEGGSLADVIAQRKRLSVAETGAILQQVADALDFAHSHGIIHRDIKPSNILLQHTHNQLVAKVVDFGISYAAQQDGATRLTKKGMFIGTPEYMSPEQSGSGAKVDHHTDQYSLAVVAYEMLCGQPPFKSETGESMIKVIIKQTHDTPPAPQQIVPSLPASVNNAILRALSKNPADRFNSCTDFIQESGMLGLKQIAVPDNTAAPAPSATMYICRKCGNQIPHGQALCPVCEKQQIAIEPKPDAPKAEETKAPGRRAVGLKPKVLLGFAAVLVLFLLIIRSRKNDNGVIVNIDPIPVNQKNTTEAPSSPNIKTAAVTVNPQTESTSDTGVYKTGNTKTPTMQVAKPLISPSTITKPSKKTNKSKIPAPPVKKAPARTFQSNANPPVSNGQNADSETRESTPPPTNTSEHAPQETQPKHDVVRQVNINQPNGAHYSGQMKNGVFDGYGVYTSPGGTRFEGQFRNGAPVESQGKWTLPDK